MSATVIALIVFVVGGLLLAMFVIGIFNNLVTLKNRVDNAFSQIDVQLQRRYDLIPNLVEIAKKYMAHERETLEAVIAARNPAHSAAAGRATSVEWPTAARRAAAEPETAKFQLAGATRHA